MAKKNTIQIAKVKYRESEGKIFIGYTRKADEFTDIRTSNKRAELAGVQDIGGKLSETLATVNGRIGKW